jgi:hypothetical protein
MYLNIYIYKYMYIYIYIYIRRAVRPGNFNPARERVFFLDNLLVQIHHIN